jgi:solute carrier family 45 protein 1/2/4
VDSVSGYPQSCDRFPLTTHRELGYGTPYLLSLGLSEQLTSLVWLAGPISGLIAQPLIGAISDSSNSRYRRRYWIVTATVLLVFSGHW